MKVRERVMHNLKKGTGPELTYYSSLSQSKSTIKHGRARWAQYIIHAGWAQHTVHYTRWANRMFTRTNHILVHDKFYHHHQPPLPHEKQGPSQFITFKVK